MDRSITPSNTELWLQTIAPGKLAKSYWPGTSRTSVASCPLGHYKLMELRPKHFHNFYTELQKIISVLEEKSLKCETYFKLIIATGMRRGKSCDLQWGNINWQERFIHIQRNVVKVTGEEIIVKDAKLLAGDWYVYFSLETGSLHGRRGSQKPNSFSTETKEHSTPLIGSDSCFMSTLQHNLFPIQSGPRITLSLRHSSPHYTAAASHIEKPHALSGGGGIHEQQMRRATY